MTRADARELAVHMIYSREFTGEDPQELVKNRLDKGYYASLVEENEIYKEYPSAGQRRYLDTVVTGVANREEELNEIISRFSIGWDISRISRITRCILQLAIFEIRDMEDVPTGVAISEAVRLAKKLDGDDTGAFVNGILGSFARAPIAEPAVEAAAEEAAAEAVPEVPSEETVEEAVPAEEE